MILRSWLNDLAGAPLAYPAQPETGAGISEAIPCQQRQTGFATGMSVKSQSCLLPSTPPYYQSNLLHCYIYIEMAPKQNQPLLDLNEYNPIVVVAFFD